MEGEEGCSCGAAQLCNRGDGFASWAPGTSVCHNQCSRFGSTLPSGASAMGYNIHASRHQGIPIKGGPRPSLQYCTEEDKGDPHLGPHCAKTREPLRRLMIKFPVCVPKNTGKRDSLGKVWEFQKCLELLIWKYQKINIIGSHFYTQS